MQALATEPNNDTTTQKSPRVKPTNGLASLGFFDSGQRDPQIY